MNFLALESSLTRLTYMFIDVLVYVFICMFIDVFIYVLIYVFIDVFVYVLICTLFQFGCRI